MSFANQFMSALYVLKNSARLGKRVLDVPEEIENQVALATLESLGISIDKATKEQLEYAKSWEI